MATDTNAYRRWPKKTSGVLAEAFSRPAVQAVVSVIALALITYVFFPLHPKVRFPMCAYVGYLVVLSFRGNAVISIAVSIASALLLDFFFTEPLYRISLNDPFTWMSMFLFTGTSLLATSTASTLKRHSRELERSIAMLQQTEEFARTNRVMLMGEMTASISHEINQPLTGIVANAGTSLRYLTNSPPDLDSAKEYLQLVVRDGRRAAQIIARVRGLTRPSSPSKTLLDLNEAIAEVVTLAQPQLSRERIPLRLELASGIPDIKGDRIQLQQVILNLLLNAADAIKDVNARELGVVIASGVADGEGVFVEVRDSGPGLKAEDADRIFTPFYTTKPDGMGMGLSISKQIIEKHGGELRAFRNEPQGAIFRFTVPLEENDTVRH